MHNVVLIVADDLDCDIVMLDEKEVYAEDYSDRDYFNEYYGAPRVAHNLAEILGVPLKTVTVTYEDLNDFLGGEPGDVIEEWQYADIVKLVIKRG